MTTCSITIKLLYDRTRQCRISATTTLADGRPACWRHAKVEQERLRIEGVRVEPAEAWWSMCELCDESELHLGQNAHAAAREWAIQHKAEAHS